MWIEPGTFKVEWEGKTEPSRAFRAEAFIVSLPQGGAIALGAGSIVPVNWRGKRIKITVELLDVD